MYNVGNTSNLTNFYEKNIFWGNIITKIEFYYYEKKGVVSDNKLIFTENTDIANQLSAYMENIKTEIYCNITYYIGAIIELYNNNYHYKCNGIKYVDNVKIIKRIDNYFYTKSNSILIYFYDIKYNTYNI